TRKLMRFTSVTPNVGKAALEFGDPKTDPVDQDGKHLFKFSECHRHNHFEGYAHYELLDLKGNPMFVEGEGPNAFEHDSEGNLIKDESGKKVRKRLGVGLKRAFCLEDFGHAGSRPITQDDIRHGVKQRFDLRTLVSGKLHETQVPSAAEMGR